MCTELLRIEERNATVLKRVRFDNRSSSISFLDTNLNPNRNRNGNRNGNRIAPWRFGKSWSRRRLPQPVSRLIGLRNVSSMLVVTMGFSAVVEHSEGFLSIE